MNASTPPMMMPCTMSAVMVLRMIRNGPISIVASQIWLWRCSRLDLQADRKFSHGKSMRSISPLRGLLSGVLEGDGVIDGMAQLLFAPEIPLGSLNRRMTE